MVPIPETASRDIHDHEIRGLFHIVERLFGGQSAEVLLHIGISFVLLGFMVYLPAALEAGAEEYESENVSFTAVAPFLIA